MLTLNILIIIRKGGNLHEKLIAGILAFLMLASLCACGAKEETDSDLKTVQELLDGGYMNMSTTISGGKFKALFASEDMSSYYYLSAPADEETESAYDALDIFDEDYSEKLNSFFLSLKNATLENLNKRLPDEEGLAKFVGKTLAELQAEGFEEYSSFYTDDMIIFTYSNGTYICDFYVDPESGQGEDGLSYVVTSVENCGIDPDIIFYE